MLILLPVSDINSQSNVVSAGNNEPNYTDSAMFYFGRCKINGSVDPNIFNKGLDFLYLVDTDKSTFEQFEPILDDFIGIENDKYYDLFLHGLFLSLIESTEYATTIEIGKKLVNKFENPRNPTEKNYLYTTLAMLRVPFRVSNNFKEGFSFYTEQLEKYLAKKDSMAISTCYFVLGGFYETKGLYDLSIYHSHQSLSYIPLAQVDTQFTYNSYQRLANNTSVLGYRYLTTGKYKEAIEYSKVAISYYDKYNVASYGNSFEYSNIAYALLLQKDFDSVLYYLNLSANNGVSEFEPEYHATSHLIRGIYYLEINQLDSSEVYLTKCSEIMQQYSLVANVFTGKLTPNYYLAQIKLRQNKYRDAEDLIIQEIPKLTNLRTELMNEYKLLVDIYLKLGDVNKANVAFTNFKNIQQEIIDDEKLNRSLSFETEQKIKLAENTITQLTGDKRIADLSRNYFIGIAGLLLTAAIILFNRYKVIKKQKVIIEYEQQRSEELLLNILPAEVAEELKQKGSAEAKHFDDVTVMFTDFKGFTKISEKLSPTELVAEIDTCFKAFDLIIQKHNIEKIKTIGDAYMCAGGLPVHNLTHASDVVMAALEIQQFMENHFKEREALGADVFEIRIGIHTGPVVAGIVGIKKFAYDIWGDTVNTASRMESSGEVGKVNISGSTYNLVKEKFNCIHRGKIEAKGKGEIDMYFVKNNW